jgi:hypothetical protein
MKPFAAFVAITLVVLAGAAGQARAEFGITPGSFGISVADRDGLDYTQAGGHPYSASTTFALNSAVDPEVGMIPGGGGVRSIQVDLPPGLLANPRAVMQCPVALLGGVLSSCPLPSRVGMVELTRVGDDGAPTTSTTPAYSVEPPRGTLATFGFNFLSKQVLLYAGLRSAGDYGVRLVAPGVNPSIKLLGIALTLYGDPATVFGNGLPAKPFLSNPTDCSGRALEPMLAVDSWQDPGSLLDYRALSPPVDGCARLRFEPTISIAPDRPWADTPAGYSVDLEVPQTDELDQLATPPLKEPTVTLPQGLSINPGLADGLRGCRTTARWPRRSARRGR